jgi:hypothetical protein
MTRAAVRRAASSERRYGTTAGGARGGVSLNEIEGGQGRKATRAGRRAVPHQRGLQWNGDLLSLLGPFLLG